MLDGTQRRIEKESRGHSFLLSFLNEIRCILSVYHKKNDCKYLIGQPERRPSNFFKEIATNKKHA
jgi:hypothetical protein